MSGRILIVDKGASGRIVLRAILDAAGYGVASVSGVENFLQVDTPYHPSLVLYAADGMAADENVKDIQTLKEELHCPLIALTGDPSLRFRLMQAGADDVQPLSLHQPMLLARIRAELRRERDADALSLRKDTHHALGFAEDPTSHAPRPAPLITLISDSEENDSMKEAITQLTRACTQNWRMGPLMPQRRGRQNADLFVIDARKIPLRPDGTPVLRVVPELRSDPETGQAMQLVIFSPEHIDFAANALDMGADDVIAENVDPAEVAHRAGLLLRRKQASDRFRDNVRRGLQAAVTDPLTGLHNRRYALSQIIHLTRAHPKLAILALDLDHFKAVNDRHGHSAGDDLLIGLADRLREILRPGDLIARIGGEEFVAALPCADSEAAYEVAERLRQAIADTPFHTARGTPPLTVTASIGITIQNGPLTPDTTAEELLDLADKALYAAKEAGRNRIHLIDPSHSFPATH